MDKNNAKNFVKEIAGIDSDFPQWYTDVVRKTELIDYGPVKGTMIIRPYGYGIWENIQRELDTRFKETGHVNAYFPLFIPYSYLLKEAEHVEGFAPEVALVTHVGSEELTEKLVVRPTSETIICDMYSKWIQSWRDLPVLINQWANVVRWEKTTRPFLRTTEFLWQEGHTAHATKKEAEKETIKMLNVYEEFCRNILAMPVLTGRKSDREKFAGAVATYSIEAMMRDGKSLQAGTSHYLGENFAKAFDIKYLDKDGMQKYVHQTSWGVTTRLIGAIIMVHGDERGLALPPKVAPIQAVILPIASFKPGVTKTCEKLVKTLKKAGIRVHLDGRDQSPGWKFNEWEMKGVPVRIECGPRDIEAGVVTVARRDEAGQKFTLPIEKIDKSIKELLDTIQSDMYIKAKNNLDSRIKEAKTTEQIGQVLDKQCFALSMWCGNPKCELEVKNKFSATTRNMPFDQTPIDDKCAICNGQAKYKIYFARAY